MFALSHRAGGRGRSRWTPLHLACGEQKFRQPGAEVRESPPAQGVPPVFNSSRQVDQRLPRRGRPSRKLPRFPRLLCRPTAADGAVKNRRSPRQTSGAYSDQQRAEAGAEVVWPRLRRNPDLDGRSPQPPAAARSARAGRLRCTAALQQHASKRLSTRPGGGFCPRIVLNA